MLGRIDTATPAAASRRGFLKLGTAAGAGLVLGFHWAGGGFARRAGATTGATTGATAPNAFIRIAPDNTVTVLIKHLEMGQGVFTGLPTLVAEELDADWSQMRAEHAPADERLYNNTLWGPIQGTGGSTAVANSYEQLRKAGAAARAMLVEAAARQWDVPAAQITVTKGVVAHAASGRTASFGDLAAQAAELDPPAEPKLKNPKDFTLIGTRLPRLDSPAKARGTAQFAMDVTLPNQVVAVVARPPVFGATLASFNAAPAKAVPGVVDVVPIARGVAVVAEGYWAATQGREALEVQWDTATGETRSSAQLMAEYRALADTPGVVAAERGDAAGALAGATQVLEADFEFPFLAHAPMEPLNCVVRLDNGRCDIWAGHQIQTREQAAAAEILGLDRRAVHLHTTLAGGGFGRRATPDSDHVSEAAEIVRALGGSRPVKLIWSREDDIRGGRYRPMYLHRMRAGLAADGSIAGWQHRIVGQSILAGTPFSGFTIGAGVDASTVEGAHNLPYQVADFHVDVHTTDVGVPVLWWRSVGHTHTAYSTEVMIDRLAEAAGRDPYAYRLGLLGGHPRHRAVMELAANKAGWGTPLPDGRGRGIAVHESFNSFVAQVAEVTVDGGGVKVDRVVCAVDCGVAINPDVIAAQMEGGLGFGLGAALYDTITLEDGGTVAQSNFHDYPSLRIDQMPAVEVHIVPSTAAPTGVGEPGTPPAAPAVANAIANATGRRLYTLPMGDQLTA